MEWSVWCNHNLFLLATEINFRRSCISGMTANQERLRNWQNFKIRPGIIKPTMVLSASPISVWSTSRIYIKLSTPSWCLHCLHQKRCTKLYKAVQSCAKLFKAVQRCPIPSWLWISKRLWISNNLGPQHYTEYCHLFSYQTRCSNGIIIRPI